LAAQALAAERAALGINQPVRVAVVKPAETLDIMAAEYKAKIDGEGGVEGLGESLAILRDMGYMPMTELNIWPLGNPPASTEAVRQTSLLPELVPARERTKNSYLGSRSKKLRQFVTSRF